MPESTSKTQPVDKLRIGSVSGAAFLNRTGKNGYEKPLKTYSFQQSHQDPKTKEWKNYNSFTFSALGSLILAIIVLAVREVLGRHQANEPGNPK